MSEIILSWLNDELQLSKRVASFEKDFNNGYLFGEILARYNQQLNFSDFVNKDDKDSRINNFTLLFDTFKSLRIGFDSNIVADIIDQKEGVSKKILYQLKMQLQKSTTNYFSRVPKTSLTPLKRVQIGKQIKDELDADLFKRRLQEIHRPQKKINEQNVLKKYVDFHKSQIEKAKQDAKKEQEKLLLARDAWRDQRRTTHKRATEFRAQWDKTGQEKWNQNVQVRKMQHDKDVLYKTLIEDGKRRNESARQRAALKEVGDGIEEFEAKFGKREYDSDGEEEGTINNNSKNKNEDKPKMLRKTSNLNQKIMGLAKKSSIAKLKDTTGMSKTLQGTTGLRMKKSPEMEEMYRRERDKRRRKMIVDQNKHQNLVEIEKREQQILYNIQQTSKQEKEIEYEIWRAWQDKQIIIENRKLRDLKYEEKKELKAMNNKFKNEELLRVYREEHQRDVKAGMIRQNELKAAHKVSMRKQIYSDCNRLVLQMLDMAEECFHEQQNRNTHNIDSFLGDLFQKFVDQDGSNQHLATCELHNYIKGTKVWNMPVVNRNSGQPEDPEKDSALPQKAVNNFYLGNILKTVFQKQLEQSGTPKDHDENVVKPELGICLLGLEYSGKKTIAAELAKQYNLYLIDMEKVIAEKLASANSVQQSQATRALQEACLSGQEIPLYILVDLIKEQAALHPRFLLIDFPLTYDQSIQITKLLSGIQPSDHIKESVFELKVKQFSRLVEPTPANVIERTIRSCGVDLLLWINIKAEASLERWLGKRKVNDKVYHLVHDQEIQKLDPNDFQVLDRGGSVIEKNNFKLNNIDDVREWFVNFGIKTEQTSKVVCWQEVQGAKDPKTLLGDCKSILDRTLAAKKSQDEAEKRKAAQHEEAEKQKVQKQKEKESIRSKCIFTPHQTIHEEIAACQASNTLSQEFVTNVATLWNTIQQKSIQGYLRSFEGMKEQRENNVTKLASLKRKFINQLTRSDSKFNLVKEFQLTYNKFMEENKDMAQEQQTKEELHQRIDDLEDKLIEIIDSKKDEASEQRSQIMASGWLESEIERFYRYVQLIAEVQIERTNASQQIIQDYYTTMYSLEVQELTDTPSELVIDAVLEIVNEQWEYPRVDKLFGEVNRVFNKQEPEITQDKNKKGGKAPPAAKKDDKKQAKKGGKEEVQEKKEPTAQQLEMLAALNTEKAIFRFRMNMLQQFAKKHLKMIKETALNFYTSLEDLLIYTHTVELEAVKKLAHILRDHVEKTQKIQTEVQLNYIDVVVSQKVLNFENPKPKIQPASQDIVENRFTISQLRELLDNIRSESEKVYGRIINRKLLAMLTSFISNKITSELFPSNWKKLSLHDFEKMISLLDSAKTGYVGLHQLFTLFILSDSALPSEKDITDYSNSLQQASPNGSITLDRFVKVGAWFDNAQTQMPKLNTRLFDRPGHLKRLLFQTFRSGDKEEMNWKQFLEAISMRHLLKREKTYFDTIFK